MKALIVVIFSMTTASAIAGVSDATVAQPTCYGRDYSTGHMEKHPDQTVKKIFFKFSKSQFGAPTDYMLGISADIKTSAEYVSYSDTEKKEFVVTTKPYKSGMYCQTENKSLKCGIDCDGGSATITWSMKDDGDKITFVNQGFQLYGGCGEEEDEGNWIWLDPKKGGDDVFILYKIRPEFCQN